MELLSSALFLTLLFFLTTPFVLSNSSTFPDPVTEALQELDCVVRIPGQPSVGFKHYAGYITVDEPRETALFYWFFEADRTPSNKPLVLWLNGGPGCSSIGFGEAQEIGPFHVEKDLADLVLNNHSWNKAANLLFLETPAGVGFSYSNATLDNVAGDNATAFSSYSFLVNWFRRFPQYKSNEFYIAGESYGGHYVPQLANVIINENRRVVKEDYINLKGVMIGNGVMDDETDNKGMVDYAWNHAVISDNVYENIKRSCNFSKAVLSQECNRAFQPYYALYNIIDMYSLYTPRCDSGYPTTSWIAQGDELISRFSFIIIRTTYQGNLSAGYDPCLQTYATEYFNRADVQEALHANVTKISHPWSLCSNSLFKIWNDRAHSVLPLVHKLVDNKVRIWILSGDTDARVPVTSTRYTLKKLGLNIIEDWSAWYNKKQVGGWTTIYEGLTFVTIRGAGHEVPMFDPEASLQIVKHFLNNEKLPSTPF